MRPETTIDAIGSIICSLFVGMYFGVFIPNALKEPMVGVLCVIFYWHGMVLTAYMMAKWIPRVYWGIQKSSPERDPERVRQAWAMLHLAWTVVIVMVLIRSPSYSITTSSGSMQVMFVLFVLDCLVACVAFFFNNSISC